MSKKGNDLCALSGVWRRGRCGTVAAGWAAPLVGLGTGVGRCRWPPCTRVLGMRSEGCAWVCVHGAAFSGRRASLAAQVGRDAFALAEPDTTKAVYDAMSVDFDRVRRQGSTPCPHVTAPRSRRRWGRPH